VRQIPDKKSIRSRLLAARAALPAETLRSSAEAVAGHLAALLADLRLGEASSPGGRSPMPAGPQPPALTVAGYLPFGREPCAGLPGGSLPGLLARLLPGATVLLPVLLPDRDLDWAEYRPAEPASTAPGRSLGPAAITAARLVVVPALAADRHGNRLGRGGGSYDRALARIGAGTVTVALLHHGELLDELPAEPHDRPVRLVITPAGIVECAGAI
jgi:5-formyltetrahydrofolate cyclo-ligase